jgi:hypothetical protein
MMVVVSIQYSAYKVGVHNSAYNVDVQNIANKINRQHSNIYIKYYKAVYDMAIYIVLYNGDHNTNDKTTHNASTPAR